MRRAASYYQDFHLFQAYQNLIGGGVEIMFKVIISVLTVFFSASSFATLCHYSNSLEEGGTEYLYVDQSSIAVLPSSPKGTKLWVGRETQLDITCYQDGADTEQNVYLWLNPRNRDLGNDLEVGVTFDGVDLTCSFVAPGKCRINTSVQLGSCGNSMGCKDTTSVRFRPRLRPFISKKSVSQTDKEGPLTTVPEVHYLAFGDFRGPTGGKGYNLYLRNLNNFRYVSCGSTLSISPKTIAFGNINMATTPKSGDIIREIPFTVSSSKQCNSVYAIGAILTPINAEVISGGLLIPSDNKVVGIRILSEDDRSTVYYNNEFRLIEATSQLLSTRRFIAQLLWVQNFAKPGSFSAGASVDIYYR